VLNLLALPAEVAQDIGADILGLKSDALRVIEPLRAGGQHLGAREQAGARAERARVVVGVRVVAPSARAGEELLALRRGAEVALASAKRTTSADLGELTTCFVTLSTEALLVASRSWKVLRMLTGIEGISSSICEI
jgi:hypothetical protein